MFVHLLIGSAAILSSMAFLVAFVTGSIWFLRKLDQRRARSRHPGMHMFMIIGAAVFLILVANTVCVWSWAILLLALGLFQSLEEAVYFSIVSFTTVGYGDVVLDKGWRILSGFVAVNGLLAFGIFTAFLIEVLRELSGGRTLRH